MASKEISAILGVRSLTGMLIKNAIVLIDNTGTQIAGGKARMEAAIDAAVSRVRPVSLGVLTTVLGMIPLLWDPFTVIAEPASGRFVRLADIHPRSGGSVYSVRTNARTCQNALDFSCETSVT